MRPAGYPVRPRQARSDVEYNSGCRGCTGALLNRGGLLTGARAPSRRNDGLSNPHAEAVFRYGRRTRREYPQPTLRSRGRSNRPRVIVASTHPG